MSGSRTRLRRSFSVVLLAILVGFYCAENSGAQSDGVEHDFPQSKAAVEQALKGMQNTMAGRLPVVEGFALSAGNSLEHYQRGYYQSKIQVSSKPSGGSVVRISVEVTAWYNDPAGTHSGYQVLRSNGRLEGDLLDQLTEQLTALKGAPQAPAAARSSQQTSVPTQVAKTAPSPAPAQIPATAPSSVPAPSTATSAPGAAKATPTTQATSAANRSSGPSISAPMPRIPDEGGGVLASLSRNQITQSEASPGSNISEKNETELRAEAESLEEVLKNQDHPSNLIAVKKSGTPVVQSASLTARTLFLASAHDEFELLDFTRDWVHVRISGLSRGWIWRNNVEMPNNIPDNDLQTNASAAPVAADLFHVTREEKAPFPGDWEPLRGKTVKIVSVEKTDEAQKDNEPHLRLEFAKSVLDKNFSDLQLHSQELAGIVLIFDSADGGMIAATLPTLQEWKAGKLSDAALWHQCFFDPPESFTTSTASVGQ